MPNPLASPKSSDRDALRDLETHPGWALIMARVAQMLEQAHTASIRDMGIQEVGQRQGSIRTLYEMRILREQMIEELTGELASFEDKEDSAHAKADAAFGWKGAE